MNFETDNYYLIGDNHLHCQDYSYSGIIDNKVPYAIIADGCSTAKDSDVGARMITHSVRKFITKLSITNDDFYVDSFINKVRNFISWELKTALFLEKEAYTSTIKFSYIWDDKLYLFHYGDGYTIIKDLDTNQIVKNYFTKFESNAPYYLYYSYNEESHKIYKDCFSGKIETENGVYENVEEYLKNENNFYQVINLKDLPKNFSVSVMSDGIDSFYKTNSDEKFDFLDEITNFTNPFGEFVKRKMKKFIIKKSKEELKHFDDLSLATIIKKD